MSSIKLKGDTSGEITIDAPAVAGTTTLTLPAESGNFITSDSNGDVTISSGDFAVDTNTLYVDSTNNRVGIGTSSPSEILELNTSSGNLIQKFNGATATHSIRNQADGSFGHFDHTNNRWLDLRDYTSDYYSLFTSGTERMRINSSGQLIHNGTSTFGYGGTVFLHSGAGGRTMNTYISSGTLQSMAMWVGGTERGYINSDSGGTTYNTSSDYRLKENVQPILDSINKVKLLKPCTWTWVDDNESHGIGFIAHELAEVVPTAVSGVKDETETYIDENNVEQIRPKYQGVDQSRIVGLLTSALQEAITKIEDLETRIQALESN